MNIRTTPVLALLVVALCAPNAAADEAAEEVVEWTDSESNADYQPKSDIEGSTWKFDPTKLSLNQGASSSGTNFKGARILGGNGDVDILGTVGPGMYGDEDHERYWFWEGKTLYLGVSDPGSKNSVDAIVEFYWFESSIPRGSDFYVMLVKVKSSPNPWDNWHIVKEDNMGFLENALLFWQDIQPAQSLSVFMEPGGANGSLRWDYSVPFETYKWEPFKVMQIQESYGAGFDTETEGEAAAGAAIDMISMFSEGGAIMDLTADLIVQAKGNVNQSFKIETQYTVTHYRWMMLVLSGGQDMHYQMAVLPAEEDQEPIEEDSAYAEYFIVMQAERGNPVHIQSIDIGGQFKRKLSFWFDSFKVMSASLTDIWLTPPTGVCLPGEVAPAGTCKQEGVCGLVGPVCSDDNQWSCPVVAAYEAYETLCDGLDNDCDGNTDEYLDKSCSTACGWGKSLCTGGEYLECNAVEPTAEVCDGLDNDCNGSVDEGLTEACDTACGTGVRTCSTGQWGTCNSPQPTTEICDGLDNDCDGKTDENLFTECQTACGVGKASCVDGTFQGCDAPVPVPETCDGLDNDCDGDADEGLKQACESVCGNGYETCVDGSYIHCTAPAPTPEQCGDQLDNDCDGIVDNGCSLVVDPGDDPAPAPAPAPRGRSDSGTQPPPPGLQPLQGQAQAPPVTTTSGDGGGCASSPQGTSPGTAPLSWIFAVAILFFVRRRTAAHAAGGL